MQEPVSVIVAPDISEGAKGLFDQTKGIGAIRTFDINAVVAKITEFYTAFRPLFDGRAASKSDLFVEKLEISIEITAKGEIRLIAAGSMETKGAIKLTLQRK